MLQPNRDLLGFKVAKKYAGEPPHICSVCTFPIAIYGRLSGCQHIFCYECTEKMESCALCNKIVDQVDKVEDAVYLCTWQRCGRSYLSEYSLKEHQRIRGHDLNVMQEHQRSDRLPPPIPIQQSYQYTHQPSHIGSSSVPPLPPQHQPSFYPHHQHRRPPPHRPHFQPRHNNYNQRRDNRPYGRPRMERGGRDMWQGQQDSRPLDWGYYPQPNRGQFHNFYAPYGPN